MPTAYGKLKDFDQYLIDLKGDKETFELYQTTYTRKVKKPTHTIIFNQKGLPDHKTLKLLSCVRADGKKYMEGNEHTIRDTEIRYFDLLSRPFSKKVIIKVDVKAAYWNYAIKRGIISEKTDFLFKQWYENLSYDEAKQARLKALGSLATYKKIRYFEEGKEQYNKQRNVVETTKPLYLEICRGIDDLMTLCCKQVEGCIYYYWDCIFATKEFSDDVIEFFKKHEYSVSTNQVKMYVQKIHNNLYYLKTSDNKIYCTRLEDNHLLMDYTIC